MDVSRLLSCIEGNLIEFNLPVYKQSGDFYASGLRRETANSSGIMSPSLCYSRWTK